jgi:hypothetical protein
MANDEAKVDASATAESTASSWDLICKISPYLDLHMMFPLLEFVNSCSYSLTSTTSKEVAQARLALLRPTFMVDYAMDIYRELHQCEEVPQEMEDQKVQVYKRLEALRTGCQPLIELCTESAMEPDRVRNWSFVICCPSNCYDWSTNPVPVFVFIVNFEIYRLTPIMIEKNDGISTMESDRILRSWYSIGNGGKLSSIR